MPTQNVNLSENHANFIRRSVSRGGYRNASEVVRAGLRILEQQEREDKIKLQALRRMAREAFAEVEAGRYIDLRPDEIDAYVDRAADRAKKKARNK